MKTSQLKSSLVRELVQYAKRIFEFQREDWYYYFSWIGLMLGLFFSLFGFIWVGWSHGVDFPVFVWNIPVGTLIFVGAIALDTIGHQTVYKKSLETGERLVHSVTIFAGVASCLALCLAYSWPEFFRIPALVLIGLSVFYSVIDEWMHWNRYLTGQSDRIEMWSHFFIFLGHLIMILSWWTWFAAGYPGVKETLRIFSENSSV